MVVENRESWMYFVFAKQNIRQPADRPAPAGGIKFVFILFKTDSLFYS
jgi:hypothetical protein